MNKNDPRADIGVRGNTRLIRNRRCSVPKTVRNCHRESRFKPCCRPGRRGMMCRRTRRMRANQIYIEADPIRSRRHRCREDKDTATSGRGKRKSEKKSTCCRPRPPEVSASRCDRTKWRPVDPGRRSARSISHRSSDRGRLLAVERQPGSGTSRLARRRETHTSHRHLMP